MCRPVPSLLSLALFSLSALAAAGAPPAPPSEDEKALREARVPADGPGLLAYFRKRTLGAAQRRRLRERIPRLGHDSFAVRQQASLELMALGPAALPHLRAALDDPDEEIKERLRAILGGLQKEAGPPVGTAAARMLRVRAPAGAVDVLLAFLPDADSEDTAEEVVCTLAVLGVRDGKVVPVLIEALKDAEPACRGGAAVVLGRSGTPEQRAAVRRLLDDPSSLVRFRAAQGLLAGRDRAALPALVNTLTDGTPAQAARAEELLSCVAGARAPHIAFEDTPAGWRRRLAVWDGWCRLNPRVDLTRADVDLPAFNATIRGRQAARLFLNAILQGDREAVRKVVGVPFLYGTERCFLQIADLETHLEARGVWQPGPRNGVPTVPRFALRTRDHLVRTSSEAEQTFFSRVRRGEIQVVEAQLPSAAPGTSSANAILLVRLSGQQAHVVGCTPESLTVLIEILR